MFIVNNMNRKRIDIRKRLEQTYEIKTLIHADDIRNIMKSKWEKTFDINLCNRDNGLFFNIRGVTPKNYKIFVNKQRFRLKMNHHACWRIMKNVKYQYLWIFLQVEVKNFAYKCKKKLKSI